MSSRATTTCLSSLLLLGLASLAPREVRAQESCPDPISSDCAEPIERMTTLPGDLVAEHLGVPVQEVLENVWQGYNGHSSREARCRVNVAGKVLIGSDPHDFTLAIHQEDGIQVYHLDISGYSVVDLEVSTGARGDESRYSLVSNDGETRKGLIEHDADSL